MEKLIEHIFFMLPTEGASYLAKDRDGKCLWGGLTIYQKSEYLTPQHLYLTSKDDVKVDDWFIFNGDILLRCDKIERGLTQTFFEANGKNYNKSGCRKVIATTNRRLIRCACELGHPCDDRDCIPKLSDETIETYIKDGVDTIRVRYTKHTHDYGGGIKAVSKKWWLKLTDKREVITQPIKQKTYTQDEVIAMLTKERERGIQIAEDFYKKYELKSKRYLDHDKDLKYMADLEAEACRKILITIDGRVLGLEPHLHNQIKREYFN